jgi:parallel beta-helix repeat protein
MRAQLTLLAVLAAACGGGSPQTAALAEAEVPTEATTDRLMAAAPSAVVGPGQSIQAAVDAAAPGAVIFVRPGVYREAVAVGTPRLAIVGLGGPAHAPVVIENPGGAANGVTVSGGADGFALVNVTVRGFEENGVLLAGVSPFLLARVVARDNGEYGLFPVRSSDGLVTGCTATGHADAGIYVGQSERVTVAASVARGNVIGIEIENSSDVRVLANEASDNTAGVLVVLLPGLEVTTSARVDVRLNRVRANDRPNFAAPGELAAAVPAGSGILVVGADDVHVEGNAVSGNGQVGIGVASTLALGALAGLPPEAFAGIDPDPDRVRVAFNAVLGNGTAPSVALPPADLFWDGSGEGSCWARNLFRTSEPAALPACAP